MPAVLIAGSAEGEREAPVPGPEPAWFQPLHVRDPAAARHALAGRVARGADALLAPTWLTHRRALLRLGESRRAAEWTVAAVRVAREAADEGLAMRTTDLPPTGVTVAGVVPRLDAWADETTGRRPPVSTALAADVGGLVGILTDAGSDVLLIEDQGDASSWAEAVRAALATGLPVWATVDLAHALEGPAIEAIGSCAAQGKYALLVDAGVHGDAVAFARTIGELSAASALEVGGLLPAGAPDTDLAAMTRGALEAGAWAVGLATAATPERIAIVRAAMDVVTTERAAAREAAHAAWRASVREAARLAPGGRAAWLSDEPPRQPPPSFDWTLAPPRDVARLPRGAFRFVVGEGSVGDTRALAGLLDEGGVLVVRGEPAGTADELEVLRMSESSGVTVVTARRRR